MRESALFNAMFCERAISREIMGERPIKHNVSRERRIIYFTIPRNMRERSIFNAMFCDGAISHAILREIERESARPIQSNVFENFIIPFNYERVTYSMFYEGVPLTAHLFFAVPPFCVPPFLAPPSGRSSVVST